ncbi:LUC7-like protein 3 (LUC7L3) [Vairimorpha necatrix]|uniref:LUC7-like protein 3 (LUC7L3) n=1 Tax=Vairimorpha necatrix TaxID=6039 RepID=A0AAX4JDR3_9MICR
MTDRARKLLDNLLGSNRDSIIRDEINNHCIFQIAGGCPYEMLKNTKLSIGSCKYKNHEVIQSVNKVLYEQELIKVLSDLFANINKKFTTPVKIKDNEINEIEESLDMKIMEIEQNITEENILEMYKIFEELENEIYSLEKLKEKFFVKNKKEEMDKCEVCGLNIIKNFSSKKFISHIEGRAHNNIKKLRDLYNKLKNKSIY